MSMNNLAEEQHRIMKVCRIIAERKYEEKVDLVEEHYEMDLEADREEWGIIVQMQLHVMSETARTKDIVRGHPVLVKL